MTLPDRPRAAGLAARLAARLRALLPAGLRARLPRERPGAPDDAPPPPDGEPDDGPPFVVPDDVWNRPRARARSANPLRALFPARPAPSRSARPRPALPRPDPADTQPRGQAPRGLAGPSGLGRSSLGAIARGLWRLGRGHADGLDCFNATTVGFLASLLPLLLLAMLMAAGGAPDAPRSLAGAVVGLLAPPVLSHALATRWGRGREWLRYAVAVNWCQWALPMLFALLLLCAQLVTGGGAQAAAAVRLILVALIAYWLWLNWFIARHALSLPGGRAALLVLLVSLGNMALVLLPQLAAGLLAHG